MAQLASINGYVELTSPQFLDDNGWRELSFDITSGNNILHDNLILPESGGGYVYKDAKSIGSATQNRFLYWRTVNDIIELVELSTEVDLVDNQVRLKFNNSPIINDINVIEFSDSIVLLIATLTSVHRLYLPHPKTTNKSVLSDLTTDILFDPENYYLLAGPSNNYSHNQSASSHQSQQPICATSWVDKKSLKCALALPNSSILIIHFNLSPTTHQPITTSEIKQIGIIGRIWSRMPNLLNKSTNDCDNAVFSCLTYKLDQNQDILLVTLCRDWKIRIFSTTTKECVLNHSMIPQSSFSQSIVSHSNATTERPVMRMFGSQLFIYLNENRPEFVLLEYNFSNGEHVLEEINTFSAPGWEKLIDFAVTDNKIWALSNHRATESSLGYLEISQTFDPSDSGVEAVWDFVSLVDDLEEPSVKNYVAAIFWRNRFSTSTIHKALQGVVGTSIPKTDSLRALEELALTSIVDDQEESWARFYEYCLQNHNVANKNIGMLVSEDECVISLVKRSNPSFICPWLASTDMVLQNNTYRGIETSLNNRAIIESLNYISEHMLDEDHSHLLEQKLFKEPANILEIIDNIIKSQLETAKIDFSKLNFQKNLIDSISSGIDDICGQIDLTNMAEEFGSQTLLEAASKFKSKHNNLDSTSGIMIVFDSFKRLVRARMNLARDLLIYIQLINIFSEPNSKYADRVPKELLGNLCESLKLKQVADLVRSYAVLVWMTEAPIKEKTDRCNTEVIDFIAGKFKYFKKSSDMNENAQSSSVDLVLHQNLFMNFMVGGGSNYSTIMNRNFGMTLSNSFYVTEVVLNLCKLLWPKSQYHCFAEFLFTNQLTEHLSRYNELTEDWLMICEHDRHFFSAANCLLQNRLSQSVEIFNRLWTNMTFSNMIGRFIDLEKEKPEGSMNDCISVTQGLIYRYYDKLVQLFQIQNDHKCLVTIINQCLGLLKEDADKEQQLWVNSLSAKLFQYYLEMDEPDEAYHTMVLTSDPALRTNCLRKFIVSHCEKKQWSNLNSYPYIDMKDDFIEILVQKAESSDLSKLNEKDFYETSFYDFLFSTHIVYDEYRMAANVMYNYAQRLACEVPGMLSIKKQADCLLIALNALRCVESNEAYIEIKEISTQGDNKNSILKRSYDSESDASSRYLNQEPESYACPKRVASKVYLNELEIKYELTKARLKLLIKDPRGNAIALAPLKAEETILQLTNSNMFSAALDLSRLMKAPMESILEGLADKYVILMRKTVNVDLYSELEREISEVFSHSYSNIETYNYIDNSTSNLVEKLWRLIDYYLLTNNGISHRYSTDEFANTFSGTTLLMKVVASKILAAGYDVPASLKRMYMTRNTPELLRLLMKYNKLPEAAELSVELVDSIMEPANTFATALSTSEPPPVYLPTHLILLLIQLLNEDATNTHYIKIANSLSERLDKFRRFVKSS